MPDPALLLPALAGHRPPHAQLRAGGGADLRHFRRRLPQRRAAAAGSCPCRHGRWRALTCRRWAWTTATPWSAAWAALDVKAAQPAPSASSLIADDRGAACSRRVLLVELFPFGRKKFAGEILPLIRAARRQPGTAGEAWCAACATSSSMRGPTSSTTTTVRAGWPTATSTPCWCTPTPPSRACEDSFRPGTRPMRTPVWHTGFVVPQRASRKDAAPRGPAAAGVGRRRHRRRGACSSRRACRRAN